MVNIDENDENFRQLDHQSPINDSTTQQLSSTSHFKKAIKYFKNLEVKSLEIPIPTKSKQLKDIKKFSLEVSKYKNKKIGGSLNLPSMSNRFSLSNIYDDVFGNGRKSFKGVPNRSALVKALATFSRFENNTYYKDAAEDDIKFELFKKRIKPKRRKSLRSVFDISY